MRRQAEPGTEATEIRDLPAGGPPRDRFEAWLSAPIGPAVPEIGLEMPRTMTALRIAGLLGVVEHRMWRDTETTAVARECRSRATRTDQMRILYRLAPSDVRAVRAAAVAAIGAAGGRVELGAVVATVVGGELRIAMA